MLLGGTTNGNGGTPDGTGGSPGGNSGTPDGNGANGNSLFAPILSTESVSTDWVSLEWTGIKDATDGRTYKLRYKTKPPST